MSDQTPQQQALAEMSRKFGFSSFTKDTEYYRLVGFRRGEETVVGIGDTWQEAIAQMTSKASSL